MIAVLLGIDGAGKSSVAERVRADLTARGHVAVTYWARWEPRLLVPLREVVRRVWLRRSRFVAGREEPAAVGALKASLMTRYRLLGRLYLTAALAEYWIQHVPRLMRLRRRAAVVILDRCWYDLVLDTCGGGPGAEQVARRLLTGRWRRLFPRVDVLVHLQVGADTAYARKDGENSRTYLARRAQIYGEAADALGATVIDAEAPLVSVAGTVLDTVAARLRG